MTDVTGIHRMTLKGTAGGKHERIGKEGSPFWAEMPGMPLCFTDVMKQARY